MSFTLVSQLPVQNEPPSRICFLHLYPYIMKGILENRTRYLLQSIPTVRRVVGTEFSRHSVALEWDAVPYVSPVLRLLHHTPDEGTLGEWCNPAAFSCCSDFIHCYSAGMGTVVDEEILMSHTKTGAVTRCVIANLSPGVHSFRLEARLGNDGTYDEAPKGFLWSRPMDLYQQEARDLLLSKMEKSVKRKKLQQHLLDFDEERWMPGEWMSVDIPGGVPLRFSKYSEAEILALYIEGKVVAIPSDDGLYFAAAAPNLAETRGHRDDHVIVQSKLIATDRDAKSCVCTIL